MSDTYGWRCVEVWRDGDEADGPTEVHVVPTYEKDHSPAGDCWCVPCEDDGVFTHRDLLDRDGPADPGSDS